MIGGFRFAVLPVPSMSDRVIFDLRSNRPRSRAELADAARSGHAPRDQGSPLNRRRPRHITTVNPLSFARGFLELPQHGYCIVQHRPHHGSGGERLGPAHSHTRQVCVGPLTGLPIEVAEGKSGTRLPSGSGPSISHEKLKQLGGSRQSVSLNVAGNRG
jgi:hypothetical protein